MRAITTEIEPEWSDDDRAMALALHDEVAERCSGCGQPLSETTDPLRDPNNPDRTGEYVAGLPYRCHACTALDKRLAGMQHPEEARLLRFPVTFVPR